jgi:hypothetical protein
MRKRKPFVHMEGTTRTRAVRFKEGTDARGQENQSRRGIFRLNSQKNSDDDFSIQAWKRRSLESTKTPKINNLTTTLSRNEEGIVGHEGTGPGKLITSTRTVLATRKTSRTKEDGAYTDVENVRRDAEKSLESLENQSHLMSRDRFLHRHQQPKQQQLHQQYNYHDQKLPDKNSHETNGVMRRHSKGSMGLPAHSKHQNDVRNLSPRRRVGTSAVVPTKSPVAIEKSLVGKPKFVVKTKSQIDTLLETGYSARRRFLGSKNENDYHSPWAKQNENDIDDMDCASSGDSCLQSTSSSSSSTEVGKIEKLIDRDAILYKKRDKSQLQDKQSAQEDERNYRSIGYNDHHQMRSAISIPVQPSKTRSPPTVNCGIDNVRHHVQGEGDGGRLDNKEFFQLMVDSTTPTTTKRDAELLGSTVGAYGRFVLHDDDSDITSLSRASKTPKRRLFPPSGMRCTRNTPARNTQDFEDETTPPLIDNLIFVAHHEESQSRSQTDYDDNDEQSIEAWSIDGNTTLPFEFEIDGKHFAHPALPPGWKMKLSRTHKKPVYIHPDHGRTWFCPVVLPHKSMNVVYTRSSLQTMDTHNAAQLGPIKKTTSPHRQTQAQSQGQHRREPFLTPPSPPSSAAPEPHARRAITSSDGNGVEQTVQFNKGKMSVSVLERLPNSQDQFPNDVVQTVKSKARNSLLSNLERLQKTHEQHLQSMPSNSTTDGSRSGTCNNTPKGSGGLVARFTPIGHPSVKHDTPGTMSELLKSYEREKTCAKTGVAAIASKECLQSGYDCDVSVGTESSSSLSSKDPRLLRNASTPRGKAKLLSSKIYLSGSGQRKLSPIHEDPEIQVNDDAEQVEEPTLGGIEGNKQSLNHHTTTTTTPFETPYANGVGRKEHSPKSGASSNSSLPSRNPTNLSSHCSEKKTSCFRTPKSSHSSKQKKDLGEQNLQVEEVAVVRHGSSRRKKRQTPLLSSAAKQSENVELLDSKSSGVSSGKNDDPTFHSAFIASNDEWSPLADPSSRLSTSSGCNIDKAEAEEQAADNQLEQIETYRTITTRAAQALPANSPVFKDLQIPTDIPGSNDLQWKSPNVSGVAPESDDLSFHSPYRSDVQTPAVTEPVASPERRREGLLTKKQDNVDKQAEAAAIHQSNDEIPVAKEDESTAIAANQREEHLLADTEALTMGSESPVVFDTHGENVSEDSMATPKEIDSNSPEKTVRSWSNRSTHRESGEGESPFPSSHVDRNDTEDHGSESDQFSNDASTGPSFAMVANHSPDESVAAKQRFFCDESSPHNPLRSIGWRVLHPPHPICSLQQLEEIFSRRRNVKSKSKRSKAKEKPKKAYGTKIETTKRRNHRGRN